MKKRVSSVSVEKVLAMSIPNMPIEAVPELDEDGIASIGMSIGMDAGIAIV